MKKFTLGLNTVKNTDYIKKYFKQTLWRIKCPTKNSVDAYVYLSQECSKRGSKNLLFLKYKAPKWEKDFYINPETSSSNSVA